MKTLRINFDYWWKRITTEFTPEFVQFFLSMKLYDLIDWTHPPEYLEQELTAAFTDTAVKKKITDKLIRLRLKDGKMKFIFVHVEFQGKSGKAFLKRMFWYYVYIMSKYKTTDITAVVIYTGEGVTEVYDRFEVKTYGTEMRYIFNTYVISAQDEATLMASNNPFAIAVLANLYVNQTRDALEKRAEYKKKLFYLAKIKKYPIAKTERLLTFVLHLMKLSDDMDAEVKSFYKKNKKLSTMATATQTKPKSKYMLRKEQLADDAKFVRDLSYDMLYGKSYEEMHETIFGQAERFVEKSAEQAKIAAAEQAKIMAAEQAKIKADTIKTMFQKTGWSADKIADISGFSVELVQKALNELG